MDVFHTFFIECSLRESNATNKMILTLLALGRGCGLVFKRESGWYLSIDDSSEFKIPNNYSVSEHHKLNDLLKTQQYIKTKQVMNKMLLSNYLLSAMIIIRLLTEKDIVVI